MKIANVLQLNGFTKGTTLNIIKNNSAQGRPPAPFLVYRLNLYGCVKGFSNRLEM